MPQLFFAALGGFTHNIWLNVLFVLIGIVLVLWGADRLTEGAVGLAERMKVSQMVIGLTVVAMGTSMPEFCVSLVSALKGTPDLAVGNIVGSNVFNSLLIVGVAAMLAPMTILKTTVHKDIPFAVLASGALFLLCLDGNIGRVDAGFLLILFVFFMGVTLTTAKPDAGAQTEAKKPMKPLVATAWLLVGLACLVFGSNLFVDGATTVAQAIGISDAVIGLTIVAGGTSLPELATSAVAARKGNSGIAIGNVLGSNVFNILLILGVTGVISPMTIQGIGFVDLSVLFGSMILLWLFSFTKYTITRLEGALLSSIYIIYVGYLIVQVVK
jgi:K+-dependent Na+/Ca+ exchanger family protein